MFMMFMMVKQKDTLQSYGSSYVMVMVVMLVMFMVMVKVTWSYRIGNHFLSRVMILSLSLCGSFNVTYFNGTRHPRDSDEITCIVMTIRTIIMNMTINISITTTMAMTMT